MSVNWHDRYRPRNEPDRVLRLMTPHDIPAAVAVIERVGWSHRAPEWERLLHWSSDGCFVIEEPAQGIVGMVSTTPYSTALAWIGMLIVSPEYQGQGLGWQLMRAVLDYLIARVTERIMLEATPTGRTLYEKLGFRTISKTEHWEGRASTYLGPRARSLRPDDVPALLELDAELFGLPRAHILNRLLAEFPELAWVDYEQGNLMGYLLGRRVLNGVRLGPWMSWHTTSAKRLLLAALEQLQGQHIMLDIPDSNGPGLQLVRDHNLQRTGHCARMIYGDAMPIRGQPFTDFAITSPATG